MINVLIHFSGSEQKIKDAQEEFGFAYVKLQRMNNTYSLAFRNKEDFAPVRTKIKQAPNVTILGGWNHGGKFIIMPNSEDNFTRAKFIQRMKEYIRRNSDGDIIEQRDYTLQELKNGVINEFYGWGKREI